MTTKVRPSEEFKALLELIMCSDPWPLSPKNEMFVKQLADRKAKECGYEDWIEAYHAS